MKKINYIFKLENQIATAILRFPITEDSSRDEDYIRVELPNFFQKEKLFPLLELLLDDLARKTPNEKYLLLTNLVFDLENYDSKKSAKKVEEESLRFFKTSKSIKDDYPEIAKEKLNAFSRFEKSFKFIEIYYADFVKEFTIMVSDVYEKFNNGLLNIENYVSAVKKENERHIDLSEQLIIILLLQEASLFPKRTPYLQNIEFYNFLSSIMGKKDFKGKEKRAYETLKDDKPTQEKAKVYIKRLENVKVCFEFISRENIPIQRIIEKIENRISYLLKFKEK